MKAEKLSTSVRKKTEMKKRISPCTPIREKAKGKEKSNGNACIFTGALRPRGRAHGRTRVREAALRRWRECIFGETAGDSVSEVVKYAIRAFGTEADRKIWTWYANRIGVNTFLERAFEVESCYKQGELRFPAAAFHQRLQRAYRQGGAK